MTLKTLIEELQSLPAEARKLLQDQDPSWSDLASAVGVDLEWSSDTRLCAYYLEVWHCTDSFVGTRAYFLDGEFVAISKQPGRKYDERFYFVNEEAVDKVRAYLLSLVEPSYYTPDLLDLDEDLRDGYTVEYSGQLMPLFHALGREKATGKPVKIIKAWDDYTNFHKIIGVVDGQEKPMDVREVEFGYATVFPAHRFVKVR